MPGAGGKKHVEKGKSLGGLQLYPEPSMLCYVYCVRAPSCCGEKEKGSRVE